MLLAKLGGVYNRFKQTVTGKQDLTEQQQNVTATNNTATTVGVATNNSTNNNQPETTKKLAQRQVATTRAPATQAQKSPDDIEHAEFIYNLRLSLLEFGVYAITAIVELALLVSLIPIGLAAGTILALCLVSVVIVMTLATIVCVALHLAISTYLLPPPASK